MANELSSVRPVMQNIPVGAIAGRARDMTNINLVFLHLSGMQEDYIKYLQDMFGMDYFTLFFLQKKLAFKS